MRPFLESLKVLLFNFQIVIKKFKQQDVKNNKKKKIKEPKIKKGLRNLSKFIYSRKEHIKVKYLKINKIFR